MVRNLNANRTSTVTDGKGERAKLGYVITTGDLADNQQLNETRWFKGVLDGGTIDPFSGKPISATNPCAADGGHEVAALNAAVAAACTPAWPTTTTTAGAPVDRYGAFWDPDEAPPAGGVRRVPALPGLARARAEAVPAPRA